ncbi:MAG: F0F1 ATP synthase subunit A [Bacteroidia bacterium]
MIVRKSFILTLLCLASSIFVFAEDTKTVEEFDASETILHHVLDTHDWHITDIPAGKDEHGNTHYVPVALHLPWFFYSSRDGFVFSSTEGLSEKGYMAHHDHVYALNPGVHPPMDEHGHMSMDEKAFEAWEAENVDHHASVYDLSITKASLHMIIVGIAMLLVFSAVARGYKRNVGKAPSGVQSMFEPIIVFIRDEVAKPYLHDKASRFLPYLLSLFFFIWFSNLFGLTPFNSNVMGNISVTAALAVLTFLLINFNGTKDYWVHIFNTPGVPWALKFGIPLMPIVEIVGIFTKPFALMIRLFANISAGHFMVLSLVCMIFILGKNGAQPGGAFGIMPLSFAFTTAIFVLEMVVAIIQAYIFTLLTSVFIGMALESHDEHHH